MVGGRTVIKSDNETINIFSVASGHLYERFLRYVISVTLSLVLSFKRETAENGHDRRGEAIYEKEISIH